MASINNMKKDNASILLADGTAIGASQNGVKYRDLSGSIGNMMQMVVSDYNCLCGTSSKFMILLYSSFSFCLFKS